MKIFKLPKLAFNFISAVGAAIAAIIFFLIVVLFLAHSLMDISSPYIGIFLYMVLPPVMIGGLLLIPIGMYWHWRKIKRGDEITHPQWPCLDLNKSSHRNATIVFIIGTIFFVTASGIGTYQAYHFTESVSFCGTTCHAVMKPEYTAYQNSPHARVKCTDCHVGSGAGWYTKSKLSGLYQVYAVIADVYPRPIPTPIMNLRPAQETCEQCHWPEKFYGGQQKLYDHYMYDTKNTSWPINMLLKIGGGNPLENQIAGIHWHINSTVKIEYLARDPNRQDIPWVKITDKHSGKTSIYQDQSNPLTAAEIESAMPRVMDCMDCHNRPSHNYQSPDFLIDKAIASGKIDQALPDIKRVAVEAISEKYDSTNQALIAIANGIAGFYENEYPELYNSKKFQIDDAIKAAQAAFSQNIFPEMKTRWSEYPVNIGHFANIGCMRCHSGNHIAENGAQISTDCSTCHIILGQGSGARAEVSTRETDLEFWHPEDIDMAWQEMGCYECHTGVQP